MLPGRHALLRLFRGAEIPGSGAGVSRVRAKMQLEALEPRILHSADLVPFVVDAGYAQPEVRVLEPAAAGPEASPQAEQTHVRRELLFVDAGVQDYQTLVAELLKDAGTARHIEVVVLDSNADGIAQVAAVLASADQPYDALHFITHGTEGAIKLGNTWLRASDLERHADDLSAWRAGLAADADLLFYGCNVAETPEGRALIEGLHAITGADVAASTDVTGSGWAFANWTLEYSAGYITAANILGTGPHAAWTGVLASLTVSTTADVVDGNTSSIAALLANKGADGFISLREAITAANNTAGTDDIILSAGTYRLTIASTAEDFNVNGDLDIRDSVNLIGTGASATIIDGNAIDRVFHVLNNSTVSVTDLTVRNGSTAAAGGGFAVTVGSSLNLTRVVLSGNTGSAMGGAIQNAGSLNATDVRLSGNSAAGGAGGGLYNTGIATLDRVTIDANTAKTGGGIENDLGGNLTLTNVTISGNAVNGPGISAKGGGILNSGTLNATNVTITGNTATKGGGINVGAGTVTLKNTIVAGNGGGADDVNGAITSAGNNLIGTTVGSSGWVASDRTNIASGLNPTLAFNGGLTPTHTLQAGSAAINAGTSAGAPATDQRGSARAGLIDIGAYEYAPPAITVSGSTFLIAQDNSVVRVNALTGAVIATYATGLANNGLASGPDGSLYVADYTNNKILRYDAAGTLLSSFGSAQLSSPQGVTIGPDNNLYVTNTNNTVQKFSASGTFLGTFIAAGNGLSNAKAIAWGPDGNAYVSSYGNSQVLRYNGATGAFLNVFASGTGGFEDLTFGPDNKLYVASYGDGKIYRYDGTTGAALGAFVSGITTPYGLRFDPAGNLDVSSRSTGQIKTYNGTTGAFIGNLDTGLINPSFIATTTSLVTTATGANASFSVVLNIQPTADVTLSFTSTNPAQGALSRSSVTFTAATWNVPQTVTISGSNDGVPNGDQIYQIDGTATSADATYTGLPVTTVVVTNREVTPGPGLWVSSTVSATAGAQTWNSSTIVQLSDPNLSLGSGTTTGTFITRPFDLKTFAADGAVNMNGFHYVSRAVTVGGANAVILQAGDLLLSTATDETLGGVAVSAKDIILFRPTNPGDYGAGAFSILLQGPTGTSLTRDFALVETATMVGGVTLNAGDFLLTSSSLAYKRDVWRYQATDVGAGTTTGTLTELVDGASTGIGFTQDVYGIELVQSSQALGGVALTPGQFLISLAGAATVGTNGLSVTQYDIFVLNVAATGTGTSSGTTSLLVRGADLGLAAAGEEYDAIALLPAAAVVPNRAPVLNTAASPVLASLNEDAGAPVGAVGTLVSSLVDFSTPAGQLDNVTDPDAGALLGIAVTNADAANGSWWYSTDSGASWNALGAVTDSGARLLAADPGTRLYFQPGVNYHGTVAAAIKFRAWDRTSGTAGGVADTTVNGGASAFSTASDTASMTVLSVNDAPVGAGSTVITNEDTPYVFSAAAFGFTDPNDTPANSLAAVRIATLPTVGALTLSGVTVTAGQYVSAADITLGRVVFTPVANANGAAYASFTFQVQDDGGTANGGIDLDPVARTLSIDVTAVNDAPFNTLPAASFTPLNTALVLSSFNGNAITVGDVDAAGAAVQVTLSATNGVLTLTGTTGLTFSVGTGTGNATMTFNATIANINTALNGLRFDPTAAYTGPAQLDIMTNDLGNTGSGGALTTSNSLAISVASVNIAPVLSGAVNLGGINEDASPNSGTLVSTLVFGKITDADALALRGIAVTAVDNTNGAWQYSTNSGASWTAFGAPSAAAARLLAADANTSVRFVPNANWNGTVASGLTFRAWDRTSGAAGGIADTTSVARTVRDNFAAVSYSNNDGTATWGGAWVDGDGNPAAGNIKVSGGSLMLSTFLGSESIYRQADLSGAAGATLSFDFNNQLAALGSILLEVSANGGTSYTTLANSFAAGPGTYSADIGAYNAADTRIRLTMNGTVLGGSFMVDNVQIAYPTPLNGGSTAFSTATASSSVVVSPVNDAPAGASATVSTRESTPFAFSAANFGFSDTSDSPANALLAVKIGALPAAGSLTLNGIAVTTGQVISVANLNAGQLVFTPPANANGTGYASFTFQVQDDGGTVNGGVDLDPVARTMTIDVTAVNNAPTGTSGTVTAREDVPLVFTGAAFGFRDSGDSPENSLLAVKIASLPGAGSLTLNGIAVTAGQFVSVSSLNAGQLVFTPAANANGAGFASFTFQVQDDGGTANGGVNLDPLARTLTIDVTSVNDAPAGTNNTVTTNEDTAYVFSTAAFGFSDPVESNAFLAVRIAALPDAGSLTLDGEAVTAAQSISAVDIAAGKLVYTPAANANGPGYASFTFQVQDDGGTANGGIDLDPVARTLTIEVTSVNDAPAGTSNTVTTNEDTAYVFNVAAFGFSDPVESNAILAVKITTLPTAGGLALSGAAVSAGQFVSAADIAAGKLVFTPAADANGVGYASFTFQVNDDGGTANGGIDLDPVARTMTIDVTPVNDAPAGTSNTVTTNEDTAYVFNAAAFGFTDALDANNLFAVKIATLPTAGALALNGAAVSAGQFVSAADIAAGRLVYTPALDANGAGYASFTFQVQDDGGTAGGGVDLDPVARTLAINVTPVNDAPTGTDRIIALSEDGSFVFSSAIFGYTDGRDSPSNAMLAVKIASLPSVGALTLDGVAVMAGQFITVADIDAGKLVFTPAADANGAGYASFTFQVQDDGGTANGGIDLDPSGATLVVDVTPVNDPPRGTDVTLTVVRDGSVALGAAVFGFSDPDDVPANRFVAVRISTLPSAGALTLRGTAVLAGAVVSAADLDAGALVFTPAAGALGAGYSTITFNVQDDGGGSDIDLVARTLTFDVKVPEVPKALAATEPSNFALLPASVQAGSPPVLPAAAPAPAAAPGAATRASASAAPVAAADPESAAAAVGATGDSGTGTILFQEPSTKPATTERSSREQRDLAAAFVPLVQTFLSMPLDTAEAPAVLAGSQDQSGKASPLAENRDFLRSLDEMREGLEAQSRLEASAVAASATVATGLSVGYVVWLLRGGVVVSTLLSSLPAWRMVDPLPVLGRMDDDERDDDPDESLEAMVGRTNAASETTKLAPLRGLGPAPSSDDSSSV